MDGRYVGADEEILAEVSPYLSAEAEIRYQVRVEVAILRVYAELGICPSGGLPSLDGLEETVRLDEVSAEEEKTRHNIRALVNVMKKRVHESLRPYVHLGPTSADITDTARALALRDFVRRPMLKRLGALERRLIGLAREEAGTPQIGRTHGQHAVPTTFGHAMALYVSRLGGRIEALAGAAGRLVGKLAGAVGTYNSFALVRPGDPREIERRVLAALGLKTSPTGTASQIAEPEPVADLAYAAISGLGVLANLADDLRHLMRSEIGEIRKVTTKEHVGSSTMPHKVNPVDFENVKSLWKAFMPRLVTVLMDQISEHQRDLTNSASGRFLNELLAGVHYAGVRMDRALAKTRVDRDAMRRNLDGSRETFVAEPLYIALGLGDVPDAYDIVKSLSDRARERGTTLGAVIRKDGWPAGAADRMPRDRRELLEAILEHPEQYAGIARGVAEETCAAWARRMEEIEGGTEA
jgi:adenylosuccinate lyase